MSTSMKSNTASSDLTSSDDLLTASPAAPPSAATQTSAVNRNITDLHLPTWLCLIAGSAFGRTALQHPLNVAVSRKRISDGESPSLKKVFSDALRGRDGDSATTTKGSSSSTSFSTATPSSQQKSSSAPLQPVKGVRNLFRGFGTAASGNVLGEVFYLVTVETVRHTLRGDWYSSKSNATGDDKAASSSLVTSSSFFSQVGIDATAGMVGDVMAMLVCTPMSVAVNKQMTAGYGLNRMAAYRSLPATLREMWHAHPRPAVPIAGLGVDLGANAGSVAGSCSSLAAGVSTPAAASSRASNALTMRQHIYIRRTNIACGMKGWYSGLSASLIMLPASGLWWGSYGQLKRAVYGAASPYLEGINERRAEEKRRREAERGCKSCSSLADAPAIRNVHDFTTTASASASTSSSPNSTDDNDDNNRIITTEDLRESLSMGHLPLGDRLSEHVHHHHHHHHSVPWYLSPTDNPILNGFAGVLATLLTTILYNPVSVIRTRLQALPPTAGASFSASAAAASSSMNVATKTFASRSMCFLTSRRQAITNSRILTLSRELIKREGYRGFFKGTLTNASVSVLDGLLFATLFELTKFGSDFSVAASEGEEDAKKTGSS